MAKNAASPTGGFSVVLDSSAEGQPWTWYNDPRNGREMWLPCDPINQATYLGKGYCIGHAVGWVAPEKQEEVLPANLQEIVNAAVKAGVQQALQAVGVVLTEAPEAPVEPKQLELF